MARCASRLAAVSKLQDPSLPADTFAGSSDCEHLAAARLHAGCLHGSNWAPETAWQGCVAVVQGHHSRSESQDSLPGSALDVLREAVGALMHELEVPPCLLVGLGWACVGSCQQGLICAQADGCLSGSWAILMQMHTSRQVLAEF